MRQPFIIVDAYNSEHTVAIAIDDISHFRPITRVEKAENNLYKPIVVGTAVFLKSKNEPVESSLTYYKFAKQIKHITT